METNALPPVTNTGVTNNGATNNAGDANSANTPDAEFAVEPHVVRIDVGGCWMPHPCLPRPRPVPREDKPRGPQTVEDRIQELLCNIMAKMDDKIEAHAKEIEAIQEGNSNTSGVNKSVDIETMKLKHEIDQRTAMFDMLRSIMDKYEQTTTEVVRSMGQ